MTRKVIIPGPVKCNDDGEPVCALRKNLVDMMGREVVHPDKFNPAVSWTDHKKANRVIDMFKRYKEAWSLKDESFKWFNRTLNKRWADNKNKNLKAYYNAANGDFVEAVRNRPIGLIDEANWLSLCEHFRSISDEDPVTKLITKFQKPPRVGDVFAKGYLRNDALMEGDPNSTENPNGICLHPELHVIAKQLCSGVQECVDSGIEEEVANTQVAIEVLGKSKLGVSQPKIRKAHRNARKVLELEQELNESQANVVTLKSQLEILECCLLAVETFMSSQNGNNGNNGSEEESEEDLC